MILLPSDHPEDWQKLGLLTDWTITLFETLDFMSVITRASRDKRTWTDKLVADREGVDCWQYIYFSQVIKFEIENEIVRLWPEKVCIKDAEHLALWYMCTRKLAHFGGPIGDFDREAVHEGIA